MKEIYEETFVKELESDYRYLHAHPETGFDLPETISYVKARLEEMGLKAEKCGKCGITVLFDANERNYSEHSQNKQAFLLRADMDALPIREESGLAFASENGNMHVCGHDAHTAILLGVARYLKKHEDMLICPVKLMFQPAEELLSGARDMIESGVLSNPQVKGGMMLHVMTGVAIETGTLVVSAGGVSAPAAEFFRIEIEGKGCHASMPHLGKDPLMTAAHLIVCLNELKARELAIDTKAVLTIGELKGADAANVIPDRIILKGSLRAYDDDSISVLKKRLEEMTEGIGSAFGTPAKVYFATSAPTLHNDPVLSRHCYEKLSKYLNCLRAEELPGNHNGGSEDFAYVSHEIPTIMVALAAGDTKEGYLYPLHHPKMRIDLQALPCGVEAMCRMVLEDK